MMLYGVMSWVIIGPGNGLALVWCQAITWTNDQNTKIFIQENAFENVICKMSAILFRCGLKT